jgi:hypothetical protein
MKALQTAFLVTVLGLALTATASASIFATGSISFTEVVLSYTGANLPVATSVTLDTSGGPPGRINSTTGVFNCTGGIGVPVGCSPSQADTPVPTPAQYSAMTTPTTFAIPLSSFLFQWGDGTVAGATRYSFTETSSSAFSGAADTRGILANGTFHDTMGMYFDNTATLIMNLTQAGGPGHSISLAGTIETTAAPEPTGMALLLGSALIGLGLVRRKHFMR